MTVYLSSGRKAIESMRFAADEFAMRNRLLFLFKDRFDRKAILLFLGLIIFYFYFFRILSTPWMLLVAGLLVGFLSISFKQSFVNIAWSVAGSVAGAGIFFAFTLLQSFLAGARTPSGTAANVGKQAFSSADSFAVLTILIAFYALWFVAVPAGYSFRRLVLRR